MDPKYQVCDSLRRGLEKCKEAHRRDLVGYVKEKRIFAGYVGENCSGATASLVANSVDPDSNNNNGMSLQANTMGLLIIIVRGFLIKLGIVIHSRFKTIPTERKDAGTLARLPIEQEVLKDRSDDSGLAEPTEDAPALLHTHEILVGSSLLAGHTSG
ncbi:MAG: hypothetical protein Q9169_007965, partial [Polycauliona sp. 2 TL-2023]